MLNGVLWVLCSGAAWRDMPERFGPWSTVYQRFRDWRNCGAFDQMAQAPSHPIERARLDRSGNLDDRFHCRSCNPSLIRRREKTGPEEPQDHALGRSRGGLTTKIHMLCDANGVPLRFLLSVGKPATSLMLNLCWMRLTSQACVAVLANAVAGCWLIKVMTLKLCAVTASAIGCNL